MYAKQGVVVRNRIVLASGERVVTKMGKHVLERDVFRGTGLTRQPR